MIVTTCSHYILLISLIYLHLVPYFEDIKLTSRVHFVKNFFVVYRHYINLFLNFWTFFSQHSMTSMMSLFLCGQHLFFGYFCNYFILSSFLCDLEKHARELFWSVQSQWRSILAIWKIKLIVLYSSQATTCGFMGSVMKMDASIIWHKATVSIPALCLHAP